MDNRPAKAGSRKRAIASRQSPGALTARTGTALSPASGEPDEVAVSALIRELGAMIDAARKQVAVAANAALTTLYWQIGRRVRTDVLDDRRAEYGGQVVSVVGRQLEARYGRGFGEKSLRHMVRFAEAFPEPEIVSALRRQLGWSHFIDLVPIKDRSGAGRPDGHF